MLCDIEIVDLWVCTHVCRTRSSNLLSQLSLVQLQCDLRIQWVWVSAAERSLPRSREIINSKRLSVLRDIQLLLVIQDIDWYLEWPVPITPSQSHARSFSHSHCVIKPVDKLISETKQITGIRTCASLTDEQQTLHMEDITEDGEVEKIKRISLLTDQLRLFAQLSIWRL